jgi:Nucleotidyl transferase of unknown function (DUF2204)
MPDPDLIEMFVFPLNEQRIRYLVTGSVAAMLYGEPRVTHDIDLVVFLRSGDLERLAKAYPSPEFYLPPAEIISIEMGRQERGHFNVIHPGSALKADFYITNRDEFQAWAFRNAKRYSIQGNTIELSPPEYVIISKLEFYREGRSEKHLRDIRAMLAVSGDQLDRSALNEWIQKREVEAEWRMVSP